MFRPCQPSWKTVSNSKFVYNFHILPTIFSNLGEKFSIVRPFQPSCRTLENKISNSFPKSIYVVSHTRRCLDDSTVATLFCLNHFAANVGYKYLFLLHEKQSTLGVWETAPTSAAWATAFYSICSHFCNCCTYSHSVCSKMKKTFPLLHLFNRGLTSTPLWLFFSSSLPLFLFFELASELIMGTWVWSVIDADRGFNYQHRCICKANETFFYRTNDVDEDGYLTTSKEQEEVFCAKQFNNDGFTSPKQLRVCRHPSPFQRCLRWSPEKRLVWLFAKSFFLQGIPTKASTAGNIWSRCR